METPVLKWPFTLNAAGTALEFVEQDTVEEITQCVALVVSTHVGELVDEPTFGAVDPTFREGGVAESTISRAITRWEPRATIVFTSDELEEYTQTIDLEVKS